MKVLLFVDGPKCFRAWRMTGSRAEWERLGDAWAREWPQVKASSRWWLVECENAEAGRAVINLYGDFSGMAPVGAVKRGQGRILASGGTR